MSSPRSQQFTDLVTRQPQNELFRFSLAQALLAEGQPDAALVHLQACAEKKPDWMMPRILLGKTLLGLNRRADARPWLESALQLALAQDHEDPARELHGLLDDIG